MHPDRLATIGAEAAPARRVARTIAAGVEAAEVRRDGTMVRWERGVSAESVLWAMWSATGLARAWQETALGGGPGAQRADRDLDAVVGLFDAAASFVDRLPQAGPEEFLDHIQGQDVPGDTLVARRPAGEAVALLTPQAAAGRQWGFVVVAGVQEGVWPDLRLRGSLLGLRAAGRRRDRRGRVLPGGAGGGPLRRDPAVPRRRHPGQRAAAGDRGAQRGRAAVGLPRHRRPAPRRQRRPARASPRSRGR